MSLQGTIEPRRHPGIVDRPAKSPKVRGPGLKLKRMTCRDILAEARDRLADRGFSWFESCAVDAPPGRSPREGLDRSQLSSPSQNTLKETRASRGEPLEAGRV